MTLQPYQRASQEIQRQSSTGLNAVGQVASTAIGGAGLAGGGAILSKIIPFLSKHIPTALAIKGIQRVAPKIGKFLQASMNQGHPIEEVFTFLKDKAGIKDQDFAQNDEEAQMEKQAQPQAQPHQTQQNQDPLEQALMSGDQGEVMRLQNINEKQALAMIHNYNQQKHQKLSNKKVGVADQEANRFQEHYGQKQNNASDEALLASLNKILSM